VEEYYTGIRARHYDADRRNDPKWHWEIEAVSNILVGLEIKSVIDAPVGSGRFLPFYGVPTYALDLSEDMIDIAKVRFPNAEYILHDIVRYPLPVEADLVVSIRFLNLITSTEADRALGNLLSSARQYAIFTARTVPDDYSSKMKVGWVYLHRRSMLEYAVGRNDFGISEVHLYEDSVPGQYQIFLCRRI